MSHLSPKSLAAPLIPAVLWRDLCVSFLSRRRRTWCRLTEADGGHFCSVDISSLASDDDHVEPLHDLQSFHMSVCGSRDANTCRPLVDDYAPQNNSRDCVCVHAVSVHVCLFINVPS